MFVTMVIKVLHNNCNFCTLDLTDMYALALRPEAPCSCIHISQITHAHVTTLTWNVVKLPNYATTSQWNVVQLPFRMQLIVKPIM